MKMKKYTKKQKIVTIIAGVLAIGPIFIKMFTG